MPAEELYTWTAAQFRAHEVLVAAGFAPANADRAINELGRAGLVIAEPVKRYSGVDELVRDTGERRRRGDVAGGLVNDIARDADGRMRRAK